MDELMPTVPVVGCAVTSATKSRGGNMDAVILHSDCGSEYLSAEGWKVNVKVGILQ